MLVTDTALMPGVWYIFSVAAALGDIFVSGNYYSACYPYLSDNPNSTACCKFPDL